MLRFVWLCEWWFLARILSLLLGEGEFLCDCARELSRGLVGISLFQFQGNGNRKEPWLRNRGKVRGVVIQAPGIVFH